MLVLLERVFGARIQDPRPNHSATNFRQEIGQNSQAIQADAPAWQHTQSVQVAYEYRSFEASGIFTDDRGNELSFTISFQIEQLSVSASETWQTSHSRPFGENRRGNIFDFDDLHTSPPTTSARLSIPLPPWHSSGFDGEEAAPGQRSSNPFLTSSGLTKTRTATVHKAALALIAAM
jgi:hypothetical protein